ncbi:MAG: Gfo/Idh/MocA family oxidoreductase, partial [Chloroflexi bacterium]|nr:Gfo/Idh/MocA family oxidoreductase [Chloroflexota bacterium]
MTLKLAIVGCGGMGLRHAFAYIELRKHFDSFDLVAVCDRHAESANHVASEVESATGRRPRVYTDFDQLLATENGIDAVDITTDTRMHHSFAIGAMESGASVLTEKPMGLTMGACREMAETAERTGKVLSIGEQYRRDPMNRLTKALVESGIIGRVSFAMKVSLSGGSALMHNTGWRALKSRAGSIIIEQGVHEIDLLIYLLGNVKHVYSATGLFTPLRRRQELNSALKNFYDHRVEDEFENRQEIRIDQEDTALAVL